MIIPTVIVLEGDETGQELLEQALRVIEPAVIGFDIPIEKYDLSLAARRRTGNQVVYDAAAAMKRTGFGFKAATVTPVGEETSAPPTPSCAKRSTGL